MDNDSTGSQNVHGGARADQGALESSIEEALIEIARGLKTVNFYPRGHPTLQAAMDKSHKALYAVFAAQEELSLVITKDAFLIGSNPLSPNNQILAGLAREFFMRQIKKIFFLTGATVVELENFLRVMAMEEELFRGKGKAEEYLEDANITHIWANEILLGQSGKGVPRREETSPDTPQLDDRLLQLMQSLRTETDYRRYLGLAREGSIVAMRFLDEKKPDQAFAFLRVFWETFNVEPLRNNMIVEAAKTAYKEIFNPAMIEHILRQITLLDGPKKEDVLKIASGLGETLPRSILEKLATNEALYSHRALTQALLATPDISRPLIEAQISDERWWVARKMAFLLGEIGAPLSVSHLLKAASHSDIRVQKEALKALSKIKAPEGIKTLIDVVESNSPMELRIHAISLLGATKERSAIPTLVKILKKRGALLNDIEFLEESVKTLGKIGSPQAAPILSELLLKRSLFARAKSINLGVEAAESLGAIGGKDAEEILRKGAENKQQEIRLASLKALKTRPQGAPANIDDTVKEIE